MGKRTTLSNKVIEFAKATIEEQEGSSPVVKDWCIIDGHLHFLTIAVRLVIEKKYFDVWVYVNLDTEEMWL